MTSFTDVRDRAGRARLVGVTAAVAALTVGLLEVARTWKVAFYIEALERSGLFYVMPAAIVAGLLIVLAYPRLSICLLAFVLPFNFVGGVWGDHLVVLGAKIAVNVMLAAAVVSTFLAPAEDRKWITGTRLGHALLAWLVLIVVGCLIGFLATENRAHWLRESVWMLLFGFALPVGTLLRGRRDIQRLLASACAGVFVLQAYAFWTLVTGRRYQRTDAWDGGASFFRAPYSSESLFVFYLAAAALLYYASAGLLNRRRVAVLMTAISLLGAGLLASMGRSLWITGALGTVAILSLIPWNRRTAKAAALVGAGVGLAIGLVAVFDSLSAESNRRWAASAVTFFLDLTSKDSTSKVTRTMEWGQAIEVWQRSPIVGMGFGHPFPVITIGTVAESVLPEPFYMHNSYLNVLAKCGAVGLLGFLYLWWRTLATATWLLHWPGDLHQRVLATALAAALVQVLLFALFTPVLTASDSIAYGAMLIGLCAAAQRARLREDQQEPQ